MKNEGVDWTGSGPHPADVAYWPFGVELGRSYICEPHPADVAYCADVESGDAPIFSEQHEHDWLSEPWVLGAIFSWREQDF